MTYRFFLLAAAMFSLQGCVVAALPLAAQLASGATSTSQMCSIAKIPGQTASLCDRIAPAAQTALKTAAGNTVNTAAR